MCIYIYIIYSRLYQLNPFRHLPQRVQSFLFTAEVVDHNIVNIYIILLLYLYYLTFDTLYPFLLKVLFFILPIHESCLLYPMFFTSRVPNVIRRSKIILLRNICVPGGLLFLYYMVMIGKWRGCACNLCTIPGLWFCARIIILSFL